ncbi:MAG: hypothetical protein AAF813_07990 [Pseudomonadota bacterium]
MQDANLWMNIQRFEFDAPGVEYTFSDKLATSNGWSKKTTAKVIAEYRKFLYLATISDKKVTPSQKVDAAWHLHLTYTHNYWEALCAGVLGGALHHEPATGPAEAPRFAAQYTHTHLLYRREFEEAPPRSIWAAPPRDPSSTSRAMGWLLKAGLFGGAAYALLIYVLGVEGPLALGIAAAFGGIASLMRSSATAQEKGFSYGIAFGDGGGDGDGGGCGD